MLKYSNIIRHVLKTCLILAPMFSYSGYFGIGTQQAITDATVGTNKILKIYAGQELCWEKQSSWDVNTDLFLRYALDEVSGTSVADSVSTNNGVWTTGDNSSQNVTGIIGNAKTITRNPEADPVVTTAVSMQTQGICDFMNTLENHSLTIATWLKVPDWTTVNLYAGPFEFGDWGVMHIWTADGALVGPTLFLPSNYVIPPSAFYHPTNEWFHWVMTWNHETYAINQYVNGNLVPVDPANAITNQPTVNMTLTPESMIFLGVALGGPSQVDWSWNNNSIDDFRIYRIPLTQSQVQTLYNWRP